MFSALLTLFVMAVAGFLAIGLVIGLLGFVLSVTFGLIGFLLFKVGPLLLIGWLVFKMVNRPRCRRQISAADQRWLDGEL